MRSIKQRIICAICAIVLVLTVCPVLPTQAEGLTTEVTVPFRSDVGFSLPDGSTTTSSIYRIPAMITLHDGTIVAAADARWNTTYDGGGLDTLTARSSDGGVNWNYTLANYFGDNGNYYDGANSTCFIDPCLVTNSAGDTVYMLVDLYPYGVALNGYGFTKPTTETGFDGDNKLQLRYNGGNYYLNLQNHTIYNSSNNQATGITVDKYFYYIENGQTHNLFFKNSPYQVARTAFLYLTKSTNGGKTWSAPKLLNLKNGSEMACLVGPGRGVTTTNGTMIIPIYSYNGNSNTQKMGFLWSADGENWERVDSNTEIWSSESAVVALKNGNLRFFFRNDTKTLHYVDYSFGTGWGNVQDTGIYTNSNTQISAITYSKTDADGNQVILVSCPAGSNAYGSDSSDVGSRTNGRIFVFTDNGSAMTCVNTIEVNDGNFMYSCLTERADGSVAILYEAAENYAMDMQVYTEAQLLPSSGGNEGGDDEGGDTPDAPSTQSITLWVGQTKQAETVLPGQLGTEGDYITEDGVAQYNISHNSSVTHLDSNAMLGTDKYFIGETVNLHQALYTFTGDNTNGFTVYNEDSSVYLNNIRAGTPAGYPGSSLNQEKITFEERNDNSSYAYGSNAFNVKLAGSSRCLYFYRSGTNRYRFDKNSVSAAETGFLIYAPVDENHTSSSELPGYYQITSEEQILSGGKYLIVAKGGDGLYYVLYPSTSTSNYYAHVAKVIGTAVTCTMQTEGTVITFTGLVPGETTVEIGSTVYTITVKAQEKSVTEQMQPDTTLNLDPISDLDLNGNDYTVTYQINSGSAVTVDNTGKVTSGSTTGSAVIEATVMRGTVHCGTVTYTVDVSEVIVEETRDYFLPVGGKAIVSGLVGELLTSMLDTDIATVSPGTSAATMSITINGISEGDTSVVVGTTQINIHVIPSNADPSTASRNQKIYINIGEMVSCDVYYSINGSKLYKIEQNGVLMDQMFYGGFNIAFFAAPDPGYVLTRMYAPGSNGDFYSLNYEGHISNSEAWPKYEDGTNKSGHGFLNPLNGKNLTEPRLKEVFDEAIALGCHGAQQFSRNDGNSLEVTLSFYTEKLPEFSKEIVGYKRGSASSTEDEANGYLNISEYTDYFVYKNGVALAFGDTLLYKFTVKSTSTNVNYTNITVRDTKIGYTETINDNLYDTPGTHSYYKDYTIVPADVGKYTEGRFVNDAQLSYTYSSAYSSGTYGGNASAEATCDIVGLVSYAWLEGTPEAIVKNTSGLYTLPASFSLPMYTDFYISPYTGETTYKENVDGIVVTWTYTGQWGVQEFGKDELTWFRVEPPLDPFMMVHSRSLTFYGRWLPSYSVVYTWEGEHPNVDLPSTVAHPQGVSYTVDNTIPVGYAYNDGTYTWIFQGWKRDGDTALNGTSQTIGAGHDYYTGSWTKTINSSSLTIKKVIEGDSYGEGEKFLFHIEGSNVDLTVAIAAGEQVTIYGLTVGETYTVTELTDWSWRYQATAVSQQKELSADATDNVLTFTNKLAVDRWLSGDHFNENQFSLNN